MLDALSEQGRPGDRFALAQATGRQAGRYGRIASQGKRLRYLRGAFRRLDRSDTIKAAEVSKFIAHLSKHGVVTVAAKAAGVSRSTAYAHREADEDFAKQWAEAIEEAADLLEKEAIRRAYSGTLRPVWHNGKKYTERVYSDTLLIFLLKGARPGKYRENHRVEVSGPGGGAIPIREVIVERVAAPEEDE